MKKEELKDMLYGIDRKREIKMVAVFNLNNLPTIGVGEIRRGREWDETTAGYVTDLHQFKEAFKNLDDGELFVFGRIPECNHRLGLKEVKDAFTKDGCTEENAEYFYLRNCTTISRIHCFVKKMEKGNYGLFDCSTAGTVIVF